MVFTVISGDRIDTFKVTNSSTVFEENENPVKQPISERSICYKLQICI